MLPLRLVLDTNVVVSGALNPDGLEPTAIVFAVTRPARLFVSPAVLGEYREVLSRPGLKLRPERVDELLRLIESRAGLVTPARQVQVCLDADDWYGLARQVPGVVPLGS